MQPGTTIRIQSVRDAKDATGGKVYEIIPESYSGPWELKEGTVLQIVSTSDDK